MKEEFANKIKTVVELTKDHFKATLLRIFYNVEEVDVEYNPEEENGIYFCGISNDEVYQSFASYLRLYSVKKIYVVGDKVYIEYSEFAPSATDACETLFRSINSSGFSKKEFLSAFNKEHRYLQGEVFSLAKNIIKNCASNDYLTDGRNEWCQRQAKNIVNNNPEEFY